MNENEEFETSKKTGFKLDLSTVLAVLSDENTVIFSRAAYLYTYTTFKF